MKRVGYVLQVLRIVSVGRIEIPRKRENAAGSRKFRMVGKAEVGLIDVGKAGVDDRDRVLLALLFVVGEEPEAVRDDGPTQLGPKSLRNVDGPGKTSGLVYCVVGHGSGIGVVIASVGVK